MRSIPRLTQWGDPRHPPASHCKRNRGRRPRSEAKYDSVERDAGVPRSSGARLMSAPALFRMGQPALAFAVLMHQRPALASEVAIAHRPFRRSASTRRPRARFSAALARTSSNTTCGRARRSLPCVRPDPSSSSRSDSVRSSARTASSRMCRWSLHACSRPISPIAAHRDRSSEASPDAYARALAQMNPAAGTARGDCLRAGRVLRDVRRLRSAFNSAGLPLVEARVTAMSQSPARCAGIMGGSRQPGARGSSWSSDTVLHAPPWSGAPPAGDRLSRRHY